MSLSSQNFITLIIGNSRLHWGYFQGRKLLKHWDTPHLDNLVIPFWTIGATFQITKPPFQRGVGGIPSLREVENGITKLPSHLFPPDIPNDLPIYIASVVSKQTQLWNNYPNKKIISLEEIPLTNTYSTLGIDRALCVYGAGETYGYPILVIDGGTALTYTAVGKEHNFLGGAILPGLQLQLRTLNQNTDALPEVSLPDRLPKLWGNETKSAIASGVIHTVISGIDNYLTAWWEEFPEGKVILTGGDGRLLQQLLKEKSPISADKTLVDQTLMFQGMAKLITNHLCKI
ncbi:MAG: pantothenate kinase [Halothece sp.]